FFESGDELLVYAQHNRGSSSTDSCQDDFYSFVGPYLPNKIWVIDAAKGNAGDKGLFFIDQDGKPYSANADSVKIIRSGKRNMASTPVGSVTSLANPVRMVSGQYKIVFDTLTKVIA